MVKRIGGKNNRKKQRNTSTLLRQKIIYLIVIMQKMFLIMTENSLASLTVTADGAADLPFRNLPQREELEATLLSSLLDYF